MRFAVVIALLAAVAFARYLRVPGGHLVPPECVHHIADGEVLDARTWNVLDSNGRVLRTIPKCPRDPINHGEAWRAWAEYDVAPNKIGEFLTDWVVPPHPTKKIGQIVYLWNGIEPSDTSAVIQPVLQWGRTPAGGGNYWAVASWYVSSEHGYAYGPLVRCEPANVIRGVMMPRSDKTWEITGMILASGKNATLIYKPFDSDKFTFAYQVLEAYNLPGPSQCDAYPNEPCHFTKISITDRNGQEIKPKWKPQVQDDSCGEHAEVEGDDVTIYYTK